MGCRTFVLVLSCALCVSDVSGLAQKIVEGFVPARRLSGSLPSPPGPHVVGWIDGTFEIAVDATGRSLQVKPLRVTPMPADLIAPSLADWRFTPAVDRGGAVPSRVLVVASFRPPHLFDAPTLGTPPSDVAAASEEIPFPVTSPPPRYPPMAVGDAVVLVEVLVGRDGQVRDPRIVSGPAGFHEASLDAARGWRFRPARRHGHIVEAYSYLVFGFRTVVGG